MSAQSNGLDARALRRYCTGFARFRQARLWGFGVRRHRPLQSGGHTGGQMIANNRRVLVTGGGTFLGDNIAAALLAEGAEVTLLVRPGAEEKIGPLKNHVRWQAADPWDPASLRGRARGHACVVNTIGSMTDDPAQGLTYHRLNFVSARNIANMVSSDGAPLLVFVSSARAPWIARPYIHAKREAEQYLQRVGISSVVVRAPLTFPRGRPRPFFFELMTVLGAIPPLSWTPLSRAAPMPIDVLARAVARIALNPRPAKSVYYAGDLRRLNGRDELRGRARHSKSVDH
jgi:uncharacterized protein YbjT (DUF2867 family)